MKFKDYTQEEKNRYISEAKTLCEYLDGLGLVSHLGFGSLLGAVRDGKLIDNDYDIDICYISKYTDNREVLNECKELYEALREKGWLVKYWSIDYLPMPISKEIVMPFGQAHIKLGEFMIDLFTCKIDADGNYNTCQWGNLGKFKGVKNVKLENVYFDVPTNHNEILTKLYGNWKTPRQDHPSKLIKRQSYFRPTDKLVTSIVLKKFHCTKHNKEYFPKQQYISTFERVEEILSKDKYLTVIKIE